MSNQPIKSRKLGAGHSLRLIKVSSSHIIEELYNWHDEDGRKRESGSVIWRSDCSEPAAIEQWTLIQRSYLQGLRIGLKKSRSLLDQALDQHTMGKVSE